MSELNDALAAAAGSSPELAAYSVGGYALVRVLGPTVSKVGEVFGDFTDYRLRNLLKLNEKVQERIGDHDLDDEEVVSPRVAHTIIDEASWIEDDLHQTYLAGLLVNARTRDANDDGAVYLTHLLSRLTADQVQLHYKIYRAYAGYWLPSPEQPEPPFDFGNRNALRQHAVVVDAGELTARHSQSAWMGLEREALITESGNPGYPNNLERYAFIPSHFGAQVFTGALGGPKAYTKLMLLEDARQAEVVKINGPESAIRLPDPRPPEFTSARIESV